MARHSAPSRRSTARARPAPAPSARARHTRTSSLAARYGSTGVLAVTAVSCGALATGEHLPIAEAEVAPAAVQLDTLTSPAFPDGPTLLSSVAPVAPEPTTFDAGALVKAVTLGEEQRARQEAEAAADAAAAAREEEERRASSCAAGDSGFETVQPAVADAGTELRCRFGVDTVYGVAGRAGTSDHPAGLALDLMVDRDPGEQLAEYAVENMDRLGIKYVIYRQRINTGSGWEAMEDRGGVTANHMDHVHVSFED
ncbi:hypothetical protein [Pseudonocardia abyssalis]|uniref:ARB-07466-like C-terminal domain-containing protein n=1 Tax=Pseudonocardia abyssalis TaxID=2792008 RepID=A0ABS6ULW7_9PSEU|nr:hypothetical protein [Pseudonocardia abyssalis]MBW0114136.1 hypothetical protein [Pseudonocardia abyssalis]MBW0133224.1 hypothetical protein [Pseudonocardia abyssalis]